MNKFKNSTPNAKYYKHLLRPIASIYYNYHVLQEITVKLKSMEYYTIDIVLMFIYGLEIEIMPHTKQFVNLDSPFCQLIFLERLISKLCF